MANSAVIELLEEGLRKIPARNEPSGRDQRSRFADGFRPLLQGMLKLAHVDGGSSEWYQQAVSVPGESSGFPFYPETTRMVVLANPPMRGLSPTTRTLFASDGKLGLRAVTFHESGEVGLLLPRWIQSSQEVSTSAYTVVTIRMDGHTKAYLYEPVLNVGDLLCRALGTADQHYPVVEHNATTGSIDSIVGFPWAGDVLADALPKLGAYLGELSQEL